MPEILLRVMLLIFALSIHLPGAMDGAQASTSNFLKDVALAGAAWFIAGKYGDDTTEIGDKAI
ncbi:MAG: hypothetical protein U5K69_13835 [Balneolaceae bacterium]|nr:hypothetical protein [Balneolaceae bacterium]